MSERAQALEARVREAIDGPGYSVIRAWLAMHGGTSARIVIEEIAQLVEQLALQAPAEGVSPQPDEGVRAENERLKKELRTASDEIRQVSTRLANVALGPDDIKALFGSLTPVSPVEPTPEPMMPTHWRPAPPQEDRP